MNSKTNLTNEEQRILNKAKEDFDSNFGRKSMRNCVSDAVLCMKKLSDFQYCSMFGVYFSDYIDYLLSKLGD